MELLHQTCAKEASATYSHRKLQYFVHPRLTQFLVRTTNEQNFNATRKNDAPCNVSVYVSVGIA